MLFGTVSWKFVTILSLFESSTAGAIHHPEIIQITALRTEEK